MFLSQHLNLRLFQLNVFLGLQFLKNISLALLCQRIQKIIQKVFITLIKILVSNKNINNILPNLKFEVHFNCIKSNLIQ